MAEIEVLNPSPPVYRASRLEFLMPRRARLKWTRICFVFALAAVLIYLISILYPRLFTAVFPSGWQDRFLGLAAISLSVWLALYILDFYFLAVSRASDVFKKGGVVYKLDFGGARRALYLNLLSRKEVDLLRLYDFFRNSKLMRILTLRLGIPREVFSDFIRRRKYADRELKVSQKDVLEFLIESAERSATDTVGAREFALLLFDFDKAFEKFLFDLQIKRDDLKGAAYWAASWLEAERRHDRWWEKSALGRIPPIGVDLSYGFTYALDKFSYPLRSEGAKIRVLAHQKEISVIESALSKNAEANVLLVGGEGVGKRTILAGLARMIFEGNIMPALAHKRMLVLDTQALTAASRAKSALESLLIKIMNETVSAGNIILILENYAEFIESAAALGVDIVSLTEPYLASAYLQVIAVSDPEAFHKVLERNGKIMKLFTKVEVREPDREETLAILENFAETLEQKLGIIITYQSLKTALDLAKRFVAEGVMPEKAARLLDHAASSLPQGQVFLGEKDVERVVEDITKVPVGKADEEESLKLLKLEEILHRRIVGQDEAVKAVSGAMRRVRAGLHAGKRPIGSFLFLGPTGVGKTETAKALAEAYFGSETALSRFDMSEFQGEEGLNKLIGSFYSKEPGVLASALRDKPFGILLFDEFEKSSQAVINLFLQILEEGFFSDAFGKMVSARNSIIIATSNAGSNLIWELIKAGRDPSQLQKEVIDEIRGEGIFSPEILNRFDAIVVYHPLGKEELRKVAKILLEELVSNLKNKDINFAITDELVEKVLEIGYDPLLGARPMRRAIADKVEELIARKILEGKLERGSSLILTAEDLKTF